MLSALSTSQVTEGGERSLADWEMNLPELHIIEGLSFSLIDLQGQGADACVEKLLTCRKNEKDRSSA